MSFEIWIYTIEEPDELSNRAGANSHTKRWFNEHRKRKTYCSIYEMEDDHSRTKRNYWYANDSDENLCSAFRWDVNSSFTLLVRVFVLGFVLFLQKHDRKDDGKQNHRNNEDLYKSHESPFILYGRTLFDISTLVYEPNSALCFKWDFRR